MEKTQVIQIRKIYPDLYTKLSNLVYKRKHKIVSIPVFSTTQMIMYNQMFIFIFEAYSCIQLLCLFPCLNNMLIIKSIYIITIFK